MNRPGPLAGIRILDLTRLLPWPVATLNLADRGVDVIFNLRFLIVVLMVALAGCATPDRVPVLTPPAYVSEDTWREVERDLGAASLVARGAAQNYARGYMESWRGRVHQRTEADFIPWFTGYWTQQWLAVKVAWYKLSIGKGTNPAVRQLATYLQEQYNKRVLDPVAKEVDPEEVRVRATTLYIQLLGEQLQGIPRRYGIPPGQFDRRLENIPAIALAPPAAHNASLYQIVHADPIAGLPAFAALIDQMRKRAGGPEAGPLDAKISPSAKRVSEKLMAKLAVSGGASAAAAAVGGVAGMVISLGATGFGVVAHENERSEMTAQLREDLNAAQDDMWYSLMEDPVTGVMAGINYIAEQIEGRVAEVLTLPVRVEPVLRQAPIPAEPFLPEEEGYDKALTDD
jgi:hypothetical protein